MDIVWRLKRDKSDKDVMGSEVGGSDEFGSDRIGIEDVGSDEERSEVVGFWDLDFALGTVICVKGELEDVITVVESVGW